MIPIAAHAGDSGDVNVLSSRADAVSGSDALIELRVVPGSHWSARLNGHDVSGSFHVGAEPGRLRALLTGLVLGKNTLTVRGDATADVVLINHSLGGPIFSGPQQTPFICQNETNGLGAARDAQCTAQTVVQYYYKSTEEDHTLPTQAAAASATPSELAPGFKAYPLSGPAPADVAQTTTVDGQTVPYIVRRELGVINRAVYDIRMLHQPGQPLPTPWTGPTPGWNGRLVYHFAGGWGASYRQGIVKARGSAFTGPLLARGYAVATSSLNAFGNESNDKIGAETLSMVKEHFSKAFGLPVHTIGSGGSGGSMEQHLIAQNYPGLLDGIVVSASFPDALTSIPSDTDCSLLDHAFKASKVPWTEEQKSAVSGFATWRTCVSSWAQDWQDSPILDPRNCDASIPRELRYDPSANPKGARCDLFGDQINVVGRDPRTGYANRALDNVGVQYGLAAFNAGQIDGEHFLELNEHLGGYDLDGNLVGARMQATPDALRIAYQHGVVLTGGGGLSEVPIIDGRPYSDDLADVHDLVRSFITRARLMAANGSADNQVIIVAPRSDSSDNSLEIQLQVRLLAQMDRWLDRIAADVAPGTRAQKIVRDKPADLTDQCVATDGEIIVEPARYGGGGRCQQMYPPHGNTRIAAGAPLADDLLKCTLKPVAAADYRKPLSADQLKRLEAIFPHGVCDYTQPGIGQSTAIVTWQHF